MSGNRMTTDRTDPRLQQVDPQTGLQEAYLVLSEEERGKGFVRLYRDSYLHQTCGGVTHMGRALSETYARNPSFYGATYCARCQGHFRVGSEGKFVWEGTDEKVGT